MLSIGDKSHIVRVSIRMPVTITFDFHVDENRDTLLAIRQEAKLVAESRARTVIQEMADGDDRIASFKVEMGDIVDMAIVERFAKAAI